MSIAALVTGRLIADPEQRTGASSKPFTLAKITAATEDGDALVSVIAFGTTGVQLAAMGKGDTVAVAGRAKVSTWTGRDGAPKARLSVTADALLTTYHLRRRRLAVAGADKPAQQRQHQPERAQHEAGDAFGGGRDPRFSGDGR
jgi:single-stranded DNA-binding protein